MKSRRLWHFIKGSPNQPIQALGIKWPWQVAAEDLVVGESARKSCGEVASKDPEHLSHEEELRFLCPRGWLFWRMCFKDFTDMMYGFKRSECLTGRKLTMGQKTWPWKQSGRLGREPYWNGEQGWGEIWEMELTEFGDGLDMKWGETSQDDSQVIGLSLQVNDGAPCLRLERCSADTSMAHCLPSCLSLLKCHLCIQAFPDLPT